MPVFDNAHSRVVAWLKILLPLAALGILSTLFLFSRTIDPSQAIPYATVDVQELAREPRITAPNYAGVTADGAAVSVSADVARPDPSDPNKASVTGLTARLETPDGAAADITAATGTIDSGAQQMVLQGGVKIVSSTGYTVTTDRMTSALGRTDLQADGAVQADGPLGHLNAGAMSLIQTPDNGGTYVLVFKGGVKLIYQPRD